MDHTKEIYEGDFLPFHPIVLLRDVAKRWLLILLTVLVVGVGTYIYADVTYAPVYQTTTTYVVTTYSSSSTVYSNLSSASSLASVFSELLNSSIMRKTILQKIGAQSFDGTISAAVIPETNLLTVKVTASDPRTAFTVAQAIIEHHDIVTYQVMDSIALEVLQSPKVPTAPINNADTSNRMKRMMLYAGVAAVALLAAVSYSRDTVRSAKEARGKLECNYLGEILHENKYKTLSSYIRRRKTSILITNPVTSFRFVETVRKLRRRVEQRMRGEKVLMVTSLLENEGKSTIAVNLALAMAQKHSRVLLIDCDLRKPACHAILEQKTIPFGVRDVLSGRASVQNAILEEKNSGLNLLLEKSGSFNSGDYVASPAMAELLKWARQEFDFVVLDLPPMAEVSDAESVAALADASLLVVRQNIAPAGALNQVIETLHNGKAKLLGCVLNDMDTVAVTAGRAYGSGYGKYGHYGNYGAYGTDR